MKGCRSFKALSVVFLLVFLLGFGFSLFPEIKVEITVPEKNGIQVKFEMMVRGTASIPSGTHLWVLAHRIWGFEDVWWPQEEAKIDPITGQWSARVIFGEPRDIGNNFEIAAIVVNEKEHLRLNVYMKKAMKARHWPPIEMPPIVVAPVFRTVRKVDHD